MTLSEISTLAGAVSAIAVLISLLFVKRQLRQSHDNQRALIQQGRANRSAEIAMRLMDAEFAEAYHNCMDGKGEITDTQLVQFIGYCRAVFLGAEDSFLQYRDGLLEEKAFNSFDRSLRSLFEAPGMKAAWAILREWYHKDFVVYMDETVRAANDKPIAVQHAQWKAAVSQGGDTRNSFSSSGSLKERRAA